MVALDLYDKVMIKYLHRVPDSNLKKAIRLVAYMHAHSPFAFDGKRSTQIENKKSEYKKWKIEPLLIHSLLVSPKKTLPTPKERQADVKIISHTHTYIYIHIIIHEKYIYIHLISFTSFQQHTPNPIAQPQLPSQSSQVGSERGI